MIRVKTLDAQLAIRMARAALTSFEAARVQNQDAFLTSLTSLLFPPR